MNPSNKTNNRSLTLEKPTSSKLLPIFKYKMLESLRSTRSISFFVICSFFGIFLSGLFLSPEFVALFGVFTGSTDRVQIISTIYYHYFVAMVVAVMSMISTADAIASDREAGLIHYLQSKPISRQKYFAVATIPNSIVLMGLFAFSSLISFLFFWMFDIEMSLNVFILPFIAFTLLIFFYAMIGALASAISPNMTKSLLIIFTITIILVLIGEAYRFVPLVYAEYESYGIAMPLPQVEAVELVKQVQKAFPPFWAYNIADNIGSVSILEIVFAYLYIPILGIFIFIIGSLLYKRADL